VQDLKEQTHLLVISTAKAALEILQEDLLVQM
jgi:hypothetical protein